MKLSELKDLSRQHTEAANAVAALADSLTRNCTATIETVDGKLVVAVEPTAERVTVTLATGESITLPLSLFAPLVAWGRSLVGL